MDVNENKRQIYEEMKFSSIEIEEGERIYNSLITSQSKEQFVNIYPNSFYGQSKDGYWVLDKPGKLTNEVKAAIINFAAHEPTSGNYNDPKLELAHNLFHSFNGITVKGPQELFDIAMWWVDIETNGNVKGALVTSLIDFTKVREEAKHKIIELIRKDPSVIKSLIFWLTHNFPRNYDYDFGKQVQQEIDNYFLSKVAGVDKIDVDEKLQSPVYLVDLLESLNKNGFKVSFKNVLREHPDPREGGQYEQPVITIDDKQFDLWSQQVLYNEALHLLCFLAESSTVRWSFEVTIVDLSSYKIVSGPPEHYQEEYVNFIGSTKKAFHYRFKMELLSIDISDFPKIKFNPKQDQSTPPPHQSPKLNCYRPSGKIWGLAWVYFVLVSAVILPFVSSLYAIITWYLPIILFNPLFTVLNAIGIMVVHNFLVIECGKVRNTTFASTSGHLSVAMALYTHWVVWIALANSSDKLIESCQFYFTHPVDLANAIWTVNQTGTWWGPGGTIKGWPLLTVWMGEALLVYFWVIFSVKEKVRMPFSEVSQEWFKFEKLPKMEFISEPEKLVEEMAIQNYDRLRKLKKEQARENSHSIFKLYSSKINEYYLTIDNYAREKVDHNHKKFIVKQIVKYISISEEIGKYLSALAKQDIAFRDNQTNKMNTALNHKNSRVNDLDSKFENNTINNNEADSPSSDNFTILDYQKFKSDFQNGYELLTKDSLFIPWGTSLEKIQENESIPKLVRDNIWHIDCAIRFGPIIVKGPNQVFENEVKLDIKPATAGSRAFNQLRKLIASLGEPMAEEFWEYSLDKGNKQYSCRIDHIDFQLYYYQEDTKIPEKDTTTLYIKKLPTISIENTHHKLGEIAVEEYLFFEDGDNDRTVFTDGIMMTPNDVKKIFGKKIGIWVNHTHRKIGFTAGGYCSVYSLDDITKIIFFDSIGRWNQASEFRISFKNGVEQAVFQSGDWSSYDDESRKVISELTGLAIKDLTIDRFSDDHEHPH